MGTRQTVDVNDDIFSSDSASTQTENMVLRTVFLPVELDRKLKNIADSQDISKNAVVRRALSDYLTKEG